MIKSVDVGFLNMLNVSLLCSLVMVKSKYCNLNNSVFLESLCSSRKLLK
jgi:hypothetical protein